MTDTSREAFEKWAVDIISDNPNWCESGDCELAWQSWQASRETEKAQPVATVQCINGVTIGYLDVMQPVGTKLYTHPTPAKAVEPIGYIRHADKTFWPHPECAVYASVSPSLAPVYAHPTPPVEVARLTDCLKRANGQTEEFERKYYLSCDEVESLRAEREAMAALSTVSAMCAQQVAVPMTEAQIFECDPVPHEMFDRQRIDFARAIEAHHKIGSKPEAGIPVSETKVRPQNCGTGHCSCIECPYPKADWSAA